MNTKRIIRLVTLVGSIALVSTASASSAPTSQFGFKGWPYRQTTPCATVASSCEPTATLAPIVTAAPTATPIPTIEPTQTPLATAVPTATPTAPPTIAPTATQAPSATIRPTATPKPTAQPTAAPTKSPVATALPTVTAPSTGGDYTTVPISVQEENAFQLLNQDRVANGVHTLPLDPELCRLARMKSCDMNANHYFAHQSPTLGSAAEMLRANGYAFVSVGENIAHHATVYKAQAAYMSSAGHRANILGSQWTKVGVGVCYDSNGFVYVTQLFVR